jgi:putative OmpL-like beta-barrel porin-2
MSMKRSKRLALGLALLAFTLPVGLAAQTTDQEVNDLKQQVQALRAEMDAMKAATAAPTATPAAGAPAAGAPAAAATEAAPPPDPLAGITSVLHGVNLTALVDGYYQYNANNPQAGTYTEPFTSVNSQFQLNLLEVQLDKPVDKSSPLGFRVALGFGNAMKAIENSANAGNDGNNTDTQYLKEGYLSYMAPIGKGLQIDFGKFVTPAGAEVLESNQNWNYTRSILFYDAIPYYHFGARVKYTFNDKWAVTGFATNGWNNVLSTNTGKTGGFSLAWNATKKISLTETYLGGPRDVAGIGDNGPWNNLSDTVLTYNPTAKLSLMANFDYDHQGFDAASDAVLGLSPTITGADYTGFAGYVKYQYSPKTALAGRYEYLNDHDGLALGLNGGLAFLSVPFPGGAGIHDHPQEFTGTLEHAFAGHLISRLEYRHDFSNNNIFEVGGGKGTPSFSDHQDTVTAGLIFVLQPAQ